ncbi:MAG: type I restriction enzyme S subunit [Candidatus Binatia bacterium]|jgi:type I restriction enzyme S subunit
MSGRAETTGVIPGRAAISVGRADMPTPKGWKWTKLTDVARLESGHTPSRKHPEYWDGGIPWIGIKDARIHHGKTIHSTLQTVTQEGLDNSAARLLPPGTICLSRTASVGYSFVLGDTMATSQDFVNWVCSDGIVPDFLMYAFMAEGEGLKSFGQGTTHTTIYYPEVKALHLCHPPTDEQRRIVARIEELFSRLDAGVAALRHAKSQLQRYKKSVLAAAVTGQLTQAWREQHADTEPAEELLERILEQRRELWDGRRKYKEPPTPITEGLPSLPSTWTWATVAQQASPDERAITDGPFGSKLKSSHYTDSGPRVLRLQNIGDGVFKDAFAHIPEKHFQTLLNHQIFAGDLLIRALGIPAHQTCMIPPSVGPAIVKADCIRFKVFEPHVNPRFTLLALNSDPVRSRSEKHIHGVGRPRLNGTEIKSIALPLAPIAEQNQIVAEVEARTSAIDHLEAELDRQITRSKRLRQSTLASAFAGIL